MKRDECLIEFSREHHLTLRLGLILTKRIGDPEISVLLEDNRTMLFNHFEEEEKQLLPILEAMKAIGFVGSDQYGTRFLEDHRALRLLLTENNPEHYSKLGEYLIAHTRFEERVLFKALQEYWASEIA